jgi:glycosyltransferase involved in cell wall biosynthesis
LLGSHTEIIFVDGNSTDGTPEEIQALIADHPELDIRLIHQREGTGKGDAVRKAFGAATGDVLMILDADLAVAPEDLPKFWNALVEEKGEFINGSRLVYPMEREAMRVANIAGNKVFSMVFSWILDQRITDTLCGTKVLWAEDYRRIAANRALFGEFDPFGDYDLLFGAANLGLRIREVPIRYRERTYGTTNIQRWRHGLLLLQMALLGARRLRLR